MEASLWIESEGSEMLPYVICIEFRVSSTVIGDVHANCAQTYSTTWLGYNPVWKQGGEILSGWRNRLSADGWYRGRD
jgi:hypothetical protein